MTQEDIIALARLAGFIDADWNIKIVLPHLEAFAKLVERRKCQELANKIQLLPFGDTASSFAAWVRSEA